MATLRMPAQAGALVDRAFPVSDEALEWLKWIAVGAMLLDHINWFVVAGGADPHATSHAWMSYAGRIAFPLFAFVFGINLARVLDSESRASRVHRMASRLLVAGVIAQVPYWILRGYFFPLNVLWTFGLALAVTLLWQGGSSWQRRAVAVALFLLGGVLVEYWWIGLGMTLGAMAYARSRTYGSLLPFALLQFPLSVLNGNGYAFVALLLIWALASVHRAPRRISGLLYWIYAGHLWIVLGIVQALGKLV